MRSQRPAGGVARHHVCCLVCRVQERNVDALMACALPYHATPQFVRLVQVRPGAHCLPASPHGVFHMMLHLVTAKAGYVTWVTPALQRL